jgi:hypothetical protein
VTKTPTVLAEMKIKSSPSRSKGRQITFTSPLVALALVLFLAVLVVIIFTRESTASEALISPAGEYSTSDEVQVDKSNVFLVITISTKPQNWERRREQRETLIKRFPAEVRYMFVTEKNELSPADLERIEAEAKEFKDIIFLDLSTGYSNFGVRGVQSLDWAVSNFNFSYYMRIDDDSFVCFDQFYEELKQRPREKFFWAKYWCWPEFAVPDENFMLFTPDVANFIVLGLRSGILRFNPKSTFAVNIQVWSFMMNLNVFDDRDRMDTQQGYLTSYIHEKFDERQKSNYQGFCSKYWYAHHVSVGLMKDMDEGSSNRRGTEIPEISSPSKTCGKSLSFNTAKHPSAGWDPPAPPLPNCYCHLE